MRVERRRRRTRRTLSGIAASSLAVGLTSGVERAGAFPVPQNCGSGTLTDVNVDAWDRYPFPPAALTAADWSNVIAGFRQWERVVGYQGNQLVNVYGPNAGAPSPSDRVTVNWENNSNPGVLATAYCDERQITFNLAFQENFRDDPAFFRGTATHEFGHLLGLQHSGAGDSILEGDAGLPVEQPAMSTCTQSTDFTVDDWAALLHKRSALGAPEVSMNDGFEYGLGGYFDFNGGNLVQQTSGVVDGNYSAYFDAWDQEDKFRTEVSVANQAGRNFDLRGYFRSAQAGVKVVFMLQRQGVNYPSPSDCGTNTYLIGNFAQNDRANATFSPWMACGSGKWSADSSYQAQQTPACNPADSFQAVDFWATVSVYTTNWGYGVRTEFDNLRIRDLG